LNVLNADQNKNIHLVGVNMENAKQQGYEDAVARKKMKENCSQAYYQGYLIGVSDLMDKGENPYSHETDSEDN
jgi:hypothetical protein